MWTFLLSLCFLTLCSGRPQEECPGSYGSCDPVSTSDPDTTTTPFPETTVDDDDMDDYHVAAAASAKGLLKAKAETLTKAEGLARQGDIRAPIPPILPTGPIPFPGPIERQVTFCNDSVV